MREVRRTSAEGFVSRKVKPNRKVIIIGMAVLAVLILATIAFIRVTGTESSPADANSQNDDSLPEVEEVSSGLQEYADSDSRKKRASDRAAAQQERERTYEGRYVYVDVVVPVDSVVLPDSSVYSCPPAPANSHLLGAWIYYTEGSSSVFERVECDWLFNEDALDATGDLVAAE